MVWWAPLVQTAIAVLRSVGRWVLRRISAVGRRRILEYLAERIDRFHEHQREPGASARRRRWLAFRIENWIRVRDWLKANWYRVTRRGARLLSDRIADEVTDKVPCETYSSWCEAIR